MAEVAVNFAVKLLGVAVDEIKLLRGVREDMRWLLGELEWMRSFLLDAERRSSSGDEAVAKWVQEITNAAYEAEDIAARFMPRRGLGFRATLRRYAFRLKELHDIGNDIKMLKEKMEDIGKRRERYGIRNIDSEANSSSIDNAIQEWRRRPLYQSEEDVIGLENDKSRVMELLLRADSRCYVIGIVGGGGMGKTTLAWQIFKSVDRSRFPKTARLDLSQNYIKNHHNPIHNLLFEMAKQVVPDYDQLLESKRTDELSELVKTNLKNGRFLILMDDMWETDVWDLIKGHLPDVKNGSRIIITTRNANVAEHPALHFPPHRMEGLDERQSWDLFTHLVFEDEEQMRRDCRGPLKELAEELVGGCGGSPLALTVLGGLLAGKEKTCSAWRDVVGSKKWLREETGKNCMQILKLSYMDLPHHLKLCFLYLSAFPEDHEIRVEKLIRLWVAEGFVVETDSQPEKTPEDIARTYIVDLKQRCLIRVHWKYDFYYEDYYYITDYCRIHDMIRELSIDEAKKVNFMNFMDEATKDGREINGAMHRLSLQGKLFSFSGVVDGASLRTLLNFARGQPIDFKGFCLLRVLDLEGAEIYELPEEVGDMVLLRYLSIKGTLCGSLPRSISRLSYLETLDCRVHHYDLVIPNNVWKIETLKHVYGKSRLDEVHVSYIVKLQTLDCVMLAPVCSSSIHHMINLQELSIRGDFMEVDSSWEALQSLPFLKILSLFRLSATDLVNTTTGFPNLQRLTIADSKIESWEVQQGSMPSLVMLILNNCYRLKRLPRGLAYCTKLHNIHCNRMEPEFLEWYDTSKEDAAWEFRGLAQYMTVLRG